MILRHDVDNDLKKAVEFADIEKKKDVKSTYFVLVTTDFYNVLSEQSRQLLWKIIDYGHEIGLHFDETAYPDIQGNPDMVKSKILKEARILASVIGKSITKVSMHRPSMEILESDLKIPGMVNSYGNTYFKEFKYLSDSRHAWREPVIDIVKTDTYSRLHILTHAVGYNEEGTSLKAWTKSFVSQGAVEKWDILNRNFSNLSSVLPRKGL